MNLTLILFNPKAHHYHLSLSFPIVLSGKKRRIEGEKEGERKGGKEVGKEERKESRRDFLIFLIERN